MTQLSSEKPGLFKGRHFNHLLIIQAVRWYVTYKLSYRDVCDLMAERGVTVVHTTVLRWVQRFDTAGEQNQKRTVRHIGDHLITGRRPLTQIPPSKTDDLSPDSSLPSAQLAAKPRPWSPPPAPLPAAFAVCDES